MLRPPFSTTAHKVQQSEYGLTNTSIYAWNVVGGIFESKTKRQFMSAFTTKKLSSHY